MSAKTVSSWAGLFSVLWMLGGYAFIAFVASPRGLFFQPLWLSLLVALFAWLGVGLLLAIAGLRRGNVAGRVCATIGVLVFLFFAWETVSAAFTRARQRAMRTNLTNGIELPDSTGLGLLIETSKTTYTNGEPIGITVVLTNSGATAKLVPPTILGADLTFAITNAAGLELKPRQDRHGKSFSGPASLELPPHGRLLTPVALERYYKLEPGIYRMRAIKDISLLPPWHKALLSSDGLTIQVVKAAAQ